MRRILGLLALVLLVGCSAVAPQDSGTTTDPADTTASAIPAVTTAVETATTTAQFTEPSPDPETDVLGWENGYWHDESIPVDATDGLNRSERDVLLHRTMARIERLRGYEFETRTFVVVESREQYRQAAERRGELDPDVRTLVNTRYEALFLVGRSDDANDVRTQESASSVQAYYDPALGNIVVITDRGMSESDGPVNASEALFAHELTHSIQHRQGRVTPSTELDSYDEQYAWVSAREGEANYLMRLYVSRCGESWDCVRDHTIGEVNATDRHPGLSALGAFPYVAGSDFFEHVAGDGNWSAVEAVFSDLPRSTEQIAFPETYPDDQPGTVTLPAVSNCSWEQITPHGRPDHDVVGVAGIAVMFMYPAMDDRPGAVVPESSFRNESTGSLDYRIEYARGWDGDRLAAYRDAANRTAYVWRLAWDSPAEADEFVAGYRDLLRYWGGERVGDGTWRIPDGESQFADTFHVHADGHEVTIVNHPTGNCLDVNLGEYRTCDDGQE